MLQFKNSINFIDELFVSIMDLTKFRTPSSPNSPSKIRNDFNIDSPFSPFFKQLKAIAKDHIKPRDTDHLRGIWIYGPAGSGKSRWVRENCKDLYDKNINKWWDGYLNQKYVVIDDWMPEHECLAYHLKKWADRYACTLETKGGAVSANYEWLIITSQYTIEECFKDPKTVEALNRRFKIYNINNINNLKLTIN